MENLNQLVEKTRKIYVHLQQLDLHNFFKSNQFDLFCEENGLEKTRAAIYKSSLQEYNFTIKLKHYRTSEALVIDFQEFPEEMVKPFLKNLLVEIYAKKQNDFVEIILSFLAYYSRYDYNLKMGNPTPIDNDLMRRIGFDLLNLDYDEQDIRMYYSMEGYDFDTLISMDDSKPTEPRNGYIEKPIQNRLDSTRSKKVFIVHGHNHQIKNRVEEYLTSIGLDPLILHKQADLGKTIIEKVEHYSDVGFAVIILTGDDQASKFIEYELSDRPQVGTKEDLIAEREYSLERFEMSLKPRARQNVIFEFGYFIGKLGRNKVAALCEDNIERPSDIDGLLYTPLDQNGDWKKKLAREINASGITIDAKFL